MLSDIVLKRIKLVMSILSKSRWKDTILRISQAKPNYKRRLEIEKEKEPERLKILELKRLKRLLKKRLSGKLRYHSKDQRLTNLNNAKRRSGWYITNNNSVIHPIRMKPLHPIQSTMKLNKHQKLHTIDPRKYGAVHLTEDKINERSNNDNQPIQSLAKPLYCVEDDNRIVKWISEDGQNEEIYTFKHLDPNDVYKMNEEEYEKIHKNLESSVNIPVKSKKSQPSIEQQLKQLENLEKNYDDEDVLSEDDEDEIFAMLETQRANQEREATPLFDNSNNENNEHNESLQNTNPKAWFEIDDENDKFQSNSNENQQDDNLSTAKIKAEQQSQNALLESLFANDNFGKYASIDMDSD